MRKTSQSVRPWLAPHLVSCLVGVVHAYTVGRADHGIVVHAWVGQILLNCDVFKR